ncbi:MAG: hypothetical protein MK207_11190 [Saprospiraceae bacterium]|nr:hypothetical protein [Saprospiraceae bacterium]
MDQDQLNFTITSLLKFLNLDKNSLSSSVQKLDNKALLDFLLNKLNSLERPVKESDSHKLKHESNLQKTKIKELQNEIKNLKKGIFSVGQNENTVTVTEEFKDIFWEAGKTVAKYFSKFSANPAKGSIEINDERYILLRASSLSVGFLNIMKNLYSDKGEKEAISIGNKFLFDISHVLGLDDSKEFHSKMNLVDPIPKLSSGPIHFAYTGWAHVEILPESNPTADDNYFLKYNHHCSFEADAWIKAGKKSDHAVCIMNSGYSSGWCEESFGIPLTSVEISCRAKGDKNCTFIMAPPHKITDYIKTETSNTDSSLYDVPLFFERKKAEEKIKQSLNEKTILLKEIHHRVKNNLQIITSLLKIEHRKTNNKEVKSILLSSRQRIEAIAFIHEKLYDYSDLSNIDINEYLKEIAENLLFSSDKMDVIDFNIKSKIDNLNADVAINLGLITSELITNSIKHGLIDNSINFNINITLSIKDNLIYYNYKDNGPGLSAGLNFETPSNFGFKLIKSLIKKLKGTILDNNNKEPGFNLVFSF